MSLLKIYTYPDKVLRKATQPVEAFDDTLKKLTEDMAETMYDAPGIGLAAPQVGKSLKLIVVDTSQGTSPKQDYLVMANPEIVAHQGKQIDEEGCLSVPELVSKVQRYKKITVTYQDVAGNNKQMEVEDRFAVVLQHEIDHLNGILFLDHLSTLKRNLYKKKRKKMLHNT